MGNQCSSPKDVSVDIDDGQKIDDGEKEEEAEGGSKKKQEKTDQVKALEKNKSQSSLIVTTEAEMNSPEKEAQAFVDDILVEAQIKLDTRNSADTLPPFMVRMKQPNNFQLKIQNLVDVKATKFPKNHPGSKTKSNSVKGVKGVQLIISSDQKEQLKKSYIAAGKLLPPQNPVDKIHQICQHTILNEKSSPLTPIVMTRSEKEEGKNFLRNLVANLAKNNHINDDSHRQKLAAVNVVPGDDVMEKILKIHQQAQLALLLAESIPKKLKFETATDQQLKSATTASDSVPLPPHVVRERANDLKKIQILAQESLQNIPENRLMNDNRQNSVESEEDGYAVLVDDQDDGDRNKQGIKISGKKSEIPPQQPLYAKVRKPIKQPSEEGSRLFSVTFADRPYDDDNRKKDENGGIDEKERSKVSEKRNRLMHRKQTGIVFPKFGNLNDLTDEDDENEEEDDETISETGSESDSSSTQSVDEPTTAAVTSKTMSLTNGGSSVTKKETKVPVVAASSPIRKNVVGDLIARFEEGKA